MNWSNVDWKHLPPKVLTPQHMIWIRVLLVENPKFYPWKSKVRNSTVWGTALYYWISKVLLWEVSIKWHITHCFSHVKFTLSSSTPQIRQPGSTQYRTSAHARTHSVNRRQQHGRQAAVTIQISIIKLTRGYWYTIDERIQSKTLLTRRTARGLNTPNVLSVTALVKWHHIVKGISDIA